MVKSNIKAGSIIAFLMPHRFSRMDVALTKFPPYWHLIDQKRYEKQKFEMIPNVSSQKEPNVHVVFQIWELKNYPREKYIPPTPNG